MNLLLQKGSPSNWQSGITLAALCFVLIASHAHAEPPHAQLRPFAPGGITIDWEHPNDEASSITLEREDPAFTLVFTALVNSFNDLGLEPSRVYRYRVCATYAQTLDCTPWLAAQTLATPPPYSPPVVPSFTNSSSTPDSITVNWTSSASYSFHQVRWAENGGSDGQNKITGRSFTAKGLRPGTYHFIVQGCNRTLLGSSCSRFSQPIEVATRLPGPPSLPSPQEIAKSVSYAIAANGDLLWYRHDGRSDGSFTWVQGAGKKVGNGWNGFSSVFSGGNGIIYAIQEASRNPETGQRTGGHLVWYRHDGWREGSPVWAGPKTVGNNWNNFSKVFSGGDGIIYAIAANGDLLWYRHDGRTNGSFTWAQGDGKKVGNGWNGFSSVFSGGNGIIYAIQEASRNPETGQPTGGHLVWYRHDGWREGSPVWAGPKTVGNNWNNFSKVFSGGDGVIYAIAANGDLHWFYHDGWRDGSFIWVEDNGKKVGVGWNNFDKVFATPSCGFGLEGNPC